MHIKDILWTWLILSVVPVMSVMGVTEPSEGIMDVAVYHHNGTHAILHINSTELDLHSDMPVPHSVLSDLRVTIEPKSDMHALAELGGQDTSSAAATDHAAITEGDDSTTTVLQDNSSVEGPKLAKEKQAELTRKSENSPETSEQPEIKHIINADPKLPPLQASVPPAIAEDSPAPAEMDLAISSSSPAVKTADSPPELASPVPETADLPPAAPFTTIMDSPTAVQPSELSQAAADNTGELGTSAPRSDLETREAVPPESEETDDETSSSEEDDEEDDDGAGWSSPIVNGTVRESGVEAASPDQKRQWKVTTFAVAMCATVGTIFVALVGVWIYRISFDNVVQAETQTSEMAHGGADLSLSCARDANESNATISFRICDTIPRTEAPDRRSDRRRMLEDDDEEFTVFNASDRQYSAKSAGKYAPLP